MKKFLALAALMTIGTASAEELKFGDLNYFLKAGQFNVGADLLVNNETTRVAEASETEVDGYLLNTHYSYAIIDSLNVTLGVNVLLDGETQTGGGASVDAMGVQNPKFGANFRLLNQANSGFNLDFGAVASVKIADQEVASTTKKDGNSIDRMASVYSEPRSSLELNSRFGKKWNEANEFYLIAGVIYHADGEYEQLEAGTVDVDSSVDFKLGGFYQYRPVNEFMMTFGAVATRYSDVDFDGGVKSTDTAHTDMQFSFTTKYLVTDSLIAKFAFTKDSRGEYDRETSAGDTKIDKRNGLQYGLGVDLLF